MSNIIPGLSNNSNISDTIDTNDISEKEDKETFIIIDNSLHSLIYILKIFFLF